MKLSKGVVEEGGLYETNATNDIDDIDDVIIEVFDKQKIDITNRIDEVKEMVDNVLSATLPKVNGSNTIEEVMSIQYSI